MLTSGFFEVFGGSRRVNLLIICSFTCMFTSTYDELNPFPFPLLVLDTIFCELER